MEGTELVQRGRGRSAKKRQAKTVEHLAMTLADLPEAELSKLPQEPELAREIELARTTRGNSSRKRQIKHLAGFLRRHDDQREAIEAALEGQTVSQRHEVLAFHHLEELRDRLCSTETFDQALEEIRSSYPMIDHRRISRLARSVHGSDDKKAAREIFRQLRKTQEQS
jgi:ribosome-associated protein